MINNDFLNPTDNIDPEFYVNRTPEDVEQLVFGMPGAILIDFFEKFCTFNEIIAYGKRHKSMKGFIDNPLNRRDIFKGILIRDFGEDGLSGYLEGFKLDNQLTHEAYYRRLVSTQKLRDQVTALVKFKKKAGGMEVVNSLSTELKAELVNVEAWALLPLGQQEQRYAEKQASFSGIIAALIVFRSGWGASAVMNAVITRNYEVLQLFIEAGASINLPNFVEDTPLMVAASHGNEKAVEILLKGGASIDAQHPGHKDTPLIIAVAKEYVDVVKLLLEKGARLDLKTKEGKTALDVAREAGNDGITNLLINAENKVGGNKLVRFYNTTNSNNSNNSGKGLQLTGRGK